MVVKMIVDSDNQLNPRFQKWKHEIYKESDWITQTERFLNLINGALKETGTQKYHSISSQLHSGKTSTMSQCRMSKC